MTRAWSRMLGFAWSTACPSPKLRCWRAVGAQQAPFFDVPVALTGASSLRPLGDVRGDQDHEVQIMTAFEMPGATVGELAIGAHVVPSTHPCPDLIAVLEREAGLSSVVVQDPQRGIALLSRARLQREFAGRNGYGQALYARRGVGDVPPGPAPLVLEATTRIAVAGEAMLARELDCRYEDAIICWPDGRLGTISLSAVMENLARAYEHQAMHDPLTDLANRALFIDRLEQSLRRAGRERNLLAVLYVDLDDFKGVNDSHGHGVGDHALVATANRLSSCLRAGDTASRLGGDEFAVLLEDLPTPADAYEVGARLLERLREPLTVQENLVLSLNASLGIVVSSGDDNAGDLLHRADIAMYKAKGGGKGRFEIFEVGMHAAVLERLTLRRDLGRALESGDFVAYYQPIVDLQSGRIVGAEALARWCHPERGLLAPGEFIPVAEETGMIVPLGLEILGQAARQTAAWNRTLGLDPLRLSVNLSARQVQDPGVVKDVERALAEAGLAAAGVTLEITESALMSDAEAAVSTLARLKELGVRLALDDFGTGYSSLSYLQRFPVDTLKLDKAFVDHLGIGNAKDSRLAQAIIGLGELMHLEVVAEGIERVEQLDRLRALGCRLGQGYYFSRPLAAQDMHEFLTNAGRFADRIPVLLDAGSR